MLRINTLSSVIRRYSIRSIPFTKEDLKGDDKYKDLNDHYSDLFTSEETQVSSKSKENSLSDDIAEINAELNELYGVESPIEVQNVEQREQKPQEFPIKEQDIHHDIQQDIQQDTQPIPTLKKESLLDKIKSNTPKIFISKSNNPFLNLAMEDYIFQNTPVTNPFKAQRLIFYTNTPCVVIGKSQNPWRETNLPYLNSVGIPVLRRNSGGGTVVHDLGNVNYSFINSKESFSRTFFGSVIVKAVNKRYGFEKLAQNERGDIIMALDKKKISGSAFKVTRGKSYHHGTMLLNSDLANLKQALNKRQRTGIMEFECRSVDSVPSPVDNLGLPNHDFIEVVSKAFQKMYETPVEIVEVDEFHNEEILKIAENLKDWKWRFGSTGSFKLKLNHQESGTLIEFHVEKGILKDFKTNKESDFEFLREQLTRGLELKFKSDEFVRFIKGDLYEWIGNQIDGTH
ncbi:Lipoate-protein ligase A [Wickerhamomyces ciferrii]|uniref:Putative lipoate-protein ligase A n=1 Tax=Wickerhamomyces ciferrii (strain ATCC 14091 / BCRC 22168 / CBS 111 / JCM 3599 / NBRC 0793 / NRRL Y-1031 F-60-10) TaxID=1206466 RepID=K0KZF5_WICCF|nr:Lipoate-protein ligase A [Wickerhamomyces ciferrii]CCH46513.1 Lipoate-protein ligase A [Wickerhamomyces ciferrii]